jgi:Fur family ferric uptake transcriptional regulator
MSTPMSAPPLLHPPAGRPTLAAALRAVRDRGLRMSAARRLVIEALSVADGPMSAEQIAGGIGGRVPPSDLATVYRNLETLEASGIVQHVHLGHGPGLFLLVNPEGREFLACERCGNYETLSPHDLDGVRMVVRRRFGYHASWAHFPIVGLCPSCCEAVTPAAV